MTADRRDCTFDISEAEIFQRFVAKTLPDVGPATEATSVPSRTHTDRHHYR